MIKQKTILAGTTEIIKISTRCATLALRYAVDVNIVGANSLKHSPLNNSFLEVKMTTPAKSNEIIISKSLIPHLNVIASELGKKNFCNALTGVVSTYVKLTPNGDLDLNDDAFIEVEIENGQGIPIELWIEQDNFVSKNILVYTEKTIEAGQGKTHHLDSSLITVVSTEVSEVIVYNKVNALSDRLTFDDLKEMHASNGNPYFRQISDSRQIEDFTSNYITVNQNNILGVKDVYIKPVNDGLLLSVEVANYRK